MAFTTVILTVFIAASVNAAYVWQDDDNFVKKPEFKSHPFNFPTFPTFPTFPHLTFPTFPTFPTIPPIVIPSPEDIAKKRGSNYNGVSISSSSSSTIDKDGKVIRTGGTTVVTNEDGVVNKFVFGDNPPEVISHSHLIIRQIPIWQPIIPVPITITQQDIKSFVPGKNENFIGASSSSFSTSANVNGVKTAVGGTSLTSNVNGDVKNKIIHFGENEV